MCPSPRSFRASEQRNECPPILKKPSFSCNGTDPILKKQSFSSNSTDDDGNTYSTSSLSSTSFSSDCAIQQSTSFSTVEIRHYPITLSNNPGGGQGPPISLDWKHDEEKTQVILLEVYEEKRSPRRDQTAMYMPEYLRRWKLLERGISMKDMHKATKDANWVRQQRKKSIQQPMNIQGRMTTLRGLRGRVGELLARGKINDKWRSAVY